MEDQEMKTNTVRPDSRRSSSSDLLACECGGRAVAEVFRVAEDCMGAQAKCDRCGKVADEIEDVWGGEPARRAALFEWVQMRKKEIHLANAELKHREASE